MNNLGNVVVAKFDNMIPILTNCVEAIEISLIFPQPIINVSLIIGGSHVWTFRDSCEPEKMQCPSLWNVMVLQKNEKKSIKGGKNPNFVTIIIIRHCEKEQK